MTQENEDVTVTNVEISETDEGVTLSGDSEGVTAKAQQIANDDMESGFRKARGEDEPTDDSEDEEVDVNTELSALRAFQIEATSKLDKATKKIQGLEGFKGSMKQQIEQGVSRALDAIKLKGGSEAPTSADIEAAMYDSQALKDLAEEFPSFAPMAKAIEALNSKIDGAASKLGPESKPVEPEGESTESGVDLSELNEAHPTWRTDVASEEFKEFALEGGPSISDYDKVVLRYQSGNSKMITDANEVVDQWRVDMPEWWESIGSKLFGGVDGNLSILNDFVDRPAKVPVNVGDKDNRDTMSAEERRNLSRQKRIRRSVAPEGKGGAPATGINDTEAFERGFNKAKKV